MLQTESRLKVADNTGAKEALRLAAQKLPVRTKFVIARDFDFNA